jgi:UDP-N-acetylmuramoyl-tripeptide--D-alanyl-D-alanine ligase
VDIVRLDANAVARVVAGTLHGPDVEVEGAAVDSRVLRPGQLFVPVPAARDGHNFIDHALVAGAAAYLTARAPEGGTAVVVDDTVGALAALGRWARDQLPGPVIGITGSAGKTSTKDFLGAVLRAELPTAVSERSFNNELGVPLTLFNAEPGTRAAVLEMGARGFGHIAWLCELARPGVGVVTNVAAAHTEMLGSIDGVAKAKAELVAALPASGTAVLNADDERVVAMAAHTEARVVTFGVENGDVRAVEPALDDELRVSFRLVSPWGEHDVRLEARGLHQAANAAGAAAAALVLDVPLERAVAALETARLSPWRMQVSRTAAGTLVINDAYNANPASMTQGLQALARARASRRVAVVGPMLELGDVSDAEHRRMGELARRLGIRLIAVGAPAYGGDDVATAEEAVALLGRLSRDDAVLVKASRAAGLERVAGALGAAW